MSVSEILLHCSDGWYTFLPADLVCESLRDVETACLFVPFRVSQCCRCHLHGRLSDFFRSVLRGQDGYDTKHAT
jgi:hypothetical protein